MKTVSRFIFIICLLFIGNLYSQTHQAVYSYQMSDKVPELMQTLRDDVNHMADNNYLLLYFDQNNSFYTSENTENNVFDQSDLFAKTYTPYYFSILDKAYFYEFKLNKLYTAVDNLLFDWEITDDQKEISGYTCIKAMGRVNNLYADDVNGENPYHTVEAWFAPSLPYNYGPKKHSGLPGLVVYAVESNRDIFKLERIEFNVKYD